MECPGCNMENPTEARFCAHCGLPMPLYAASRTRDPRARAHFCTGCGRPMAGSSSSHAPVVPVLSLRERFGVRTVYWWGLLVMIALWGGVMGVSRYLDHRDSGLDLKFTVVPKGCFRMGSTDALRESPAHEVCLEWFFLSRFEVTQTQWKAVMGENPSSLTNCGENCPVNNVTWDMVQTFIDRLNRMSGAQYRLPTEAEWEYACRGGNQQRHCGGDDIGQVAWHKGNTDAIHPVGQKAPNGFGLHDMNGNVWEWVSDRFDEHYYAKSPKNNPQGPETGVFRVFRGGSVKSSPEFMRPTQRNAGDPRTGFGDLGFRLVKLP